MLCWGRVCVCAPPAGLWVPLLPLFDGRVCVVCVFCPVVAVVWLAVVVVLVTAVVGSVLVTVESPRVSALAAAL